MTTVDLTARATLDLPAYAETATYPAARALLLKHVADRVAAVSMLLLLTPLLLVLCVAIATTSRGPVLYRQTRYGLNGRAFRMWKLRTMVRGADQLRAPENEADGLLFKVRSDPRVTRLGGFLRKWSLDELPQLVNVIGGQMSLVGPRPLPVHPSSYSSIEARRLAVRPGITGLWQVSGRSDACWSQCVRLDLKYVETWSLWLDVCILARTVTAVARRAGAY